MKHHKTIIISDLHLGMKSSKSAEVVKFLKNNTCEKLILNGDIIDGWHLMKYGKWRSKDTRFFKLIMKYVSKSKMDVIYLRGNHDMIVEKFIPFSFNKFKLTKQYIHESCGKQYLVVHGDVFDSITSNMKWLSKLGSVMYDMLLWVNHLYNIYRTKRGLPYYSLSQYIKGKVKAAVSFSDNYESQLVDLAKQQKCDGIICGHIHKSANKMIGDIHYLNSGDWVESLTALTEDNDGNWNVVNYYEWLKKFEEEQSKNTEAKTQTVQSIEFVEPTQPS